MPNAHDFTGITELAGDPASREQVDRLHRRYYWAGDYARGKDVLEVACGAGQGLGYLQQMARSVCGADLSEPVLAGARRHYAGRVDLRCFDAQEMPLADASFDVVLMFEALYYLPDASRFVREARRVLRPGGVLLISSANKDLYEFTPSPQSVRYYGVVELGALLAESGFAARFFGDTDVTAVSWRQRVTRPLKKLATAANLMPKNKALKAMLKRVVFGPIDRLPAEVAPGYPDPGLPLATVPAGAADRRHKVIYCEATRPT